jgi:AraC-like DNA-binding protein
VDLAIRMLAQNTNHISIESLSNQFFLSRRQFERKSKERVGVSPQLFSRINRFTRAYKMREACSGHTWTQIAHASGYYDQAHFIRDFKTFSGILPTMVDERLSDSIRLLSALEGFE